MPSDTYILTISDAGVSVPSVGSVTNTSVAADAAIAFSKLASLTSGNVLVGNSSNVPTSVAVTGDVTISNTGVTSIASGAVVNADINASAAIAHSKLASMSSGNILVGSSGSVPTSVAVTGDVTISNAGLTTIANDAVTFGKMQPVSGFSIVGKPTTGSGDIAEIGSSSFMLEASTGFLRQADAAAARSTLGLGALSTQDTLSVATGGTGQTSYTIGDILYASGATALSKLAGVATGNALISGGIGVAPSYGKIGLTTHVSGVLPVANGGTGVTTSTGSGANALATSPVLVTPQLGTPTSGTLTSCTGLPISGLVSSTSTALGVGSIELGHATDTTISRVSAGRIAVEGVNVVTASSTDTLTNKTLVTPVLGTPTSGTLTNCTGLPIDGGTTGTLPVDKGGTGVTQSAYAESYISTSADTTYSAINTWYKISGSTSLTTGENFDDAGGTNNRIRYTGTANRAFFITVCGTVTGSNANTILVGLYINGAHADASITAVTISGSLKHQFSSQAIVFLDTNDYIEVHTQNQSSTNNATFERLSICAHALV